VLPCIVQDSVRGLCLYIECMPPQLLLICIAVGSACQRRLYSCHSSHCAWMLAWLCYLTHSMC